MGIAVRRDRNATLTPQRRRPDMNTTTRSRCNCGKVKSRYANHCKACDKARREKRVAEAVAVVKEGKCPHCGSALRVEVKTKRPLPLIKRDLGAALDMLGVAYETKDPSCIAYHKIRVTLLLEELTYNRYGRTDVT